MLAAGVLRNSQTCNILQPCICLVTHVPNVPVHACKFPFPHTHTHAHAHLREQFPSRSSRRSFTRAEVHAVTRFQQELQKFREPPRPDVQALRTVIVTCFRAFSLANPCYHATINMTTKPLPTRQHVLRLKLGILNWCDALYATEKCSTLHLASLLRGYSVLFWPSACRQRTFAAASILHETGAAQA